MDRSRARAPRCPRVCSKGDPFGPRDTMEIVRKRKIDDRGGRMKKTYEVLGNLTSETLRRLSTGFRTEARYGPHVWWGPNERRMNGAGVPGPCRTKTREGPKKKKRTKAKEREGGEWRKGLAMGPRGAEGGITLERRGLNGVRPTRPAKAQPHPRPRNYHLHSVIMFVHNVCTHVKSII